MNIHIYGHVCRYDSSYKLASSVGAERGSTRSRSSSCLCCVSVWSDLCLKSPTKPFACSRPTDLRSAPRRAGIPGSEERHVSRNRLTRRQAGSPRIRYRASTTQKTADESDRTASRSSSTRPTVAPSGTRAHRTPGRTNESTLPACHRSGSREPRPGSCHRCSGYPGLVGV